MAGRKFGYGVNLKRPPYKRPRPGDSDHDRAIFRDYTDHQDTPFGDGIKSRYMLDSKRKTHHDEQTLPENSAAFITFANMFRLAALKAASLGETGVKPPTVAEC